MKNIIKQQLRGLGFGEKVNTFIIGAEKCGTTTLHNTLVQHPEIYGPGAYMKEAHFWNGGPGLKSKAEYENRYPFLVRPKTRLIDSTPSYISSNGTIQKIFDYNPKAKFILLLRNPVKRALSAWIMYHHAFQSGNSWRLTNVIGIGGNDNNILNFLIRTVKNNQYFTVWEKAQRNFVAAELTPRFVKFILEKKGSKRTFELVSPVSYYIEEIAKILEDNLNIKANYKLSAGMENSFESNHESQQFFDELNEPLDLKYLIKKNDPTSY